jgi:hypothetical protein
VVSHPFDLLATIGLSELDSKVDVSGDQPPSFAEGIDGPMSLWHSQVPSHQWMLARERGSDDVEVSFLFLILDDYYLFFTIYSLGLLFFDYYFLIIIF